MTKTADSPEVKQGFPKTRIGRILTVIVACVVVANGMYGLWNLTRSTKDRIAADIAALKSASNDLLRKEIMERLCTYSESDQPPVAPVVEVGTAVFGKINATKENYQIDQFGFFLSTIRYLGTHDQIGESLELLTQLKACVPTLDSVDVGVKIIHAKAVIAHAEISIRSIQKSLNDAERKGVEGLQKTLVSIRP